MTLIKSTPIQTSRIKIRTMYFGNRTAFFIEQDNVFKFFTDSDFMNFITNTTDKGWRLG